jgi:hypothetical protein
MPPERMSVGTCQHVNMVSSQVASTRTKNVAEANGVPLCETFAGAGGAELTANNLVLEFRLLDVLT